MTNDNLQPASIVEQTFHGQMCSRLECTECGHFSGENFTKEAEK